MLNMLWDTINMTNNEFGKDKSLSLIQLCCIKFAFSIVKQMVFIDKNGRTETIVFYLLLS